MSDRYILKDRKPVVCPDLLAWAEWFGESNRRVADDRLPDDVRVSTVFLGLDHQWGKGPPLLFETMIFGGKHDQYQERYSTWDQAEKGHAAALKLAQEP